MKKLWKHQEEAVSKAVDSEGFGLLFDCGTGKTLTAIKIAEEKYKKYDMHVLVIAPGNLINQWKKELSELEIPYEIFEALPKSRQRKNYKDELDKFLEL